MSDEQNWTKNQPLAELIDELDELIGKFTEIGEDKFDIVLHAIFFAIVLQAISSARVLDGDDPVSKYF